MTAEQLQREQDFVEQLATEYADIKRAEEETRQYARLALIAERKRKSILERIKVLQKKKPIGERKFLTHGRRFKWLA